MWRGRQRPGTAAGVAALRLAAGLLGASCASTPRVAVDEHPPMFFPPAPDSPRVQYLTSINDSSQFRVERSSMAKFVLGEDEGAVQRMAKPYGVAMYDGTIFVCDSLLGVIHKFDVARRRYAIMGHSPGEGRLQKPINLTFGPDGTRYVADIQRGQIVVFDRNDKYLRAIGTPEECRPTGCVLVGEDLFLIDVSEHEVERRNSVTGQLIDRWGGPGMDAGKLFKPTNIAVGPDDRLYITDTINCRVQVYDLEGNLVDGMGMPGDKIGQFIRPKGVAVDPDGLVYVADAAFDNVQIFGPVEDHYEAYMYFGGGGLGPGNMSLPAGITIATDGLQYFQKYLAPDFEGEYLVIVVNQFGDYRVSIYAKGHRRGAG